MLPTCNGDDIRSWSSEAESDGTRYAAKDFANVGRLVCELVRWVCLAADDPIEAAPIRLN
jgi:hypothetical protein